MSNPVGLVTGSSSGIGAAIASTFAQNGCDVVVNYNTGKDRAEQIASDLGSKYDVETLTLQADLAQREAAFGLVDHTISHFGRLDVVVSNSGVVNYVPDAEGNLVRYRFAETPMDHLDAEMARVMDLNLMGAYRLMQRSMHHMTAQAEKEIADGREPLHRSILVISSISDVAPDATRIPYGVSKAGIHHAIIGAAFEGGPFNITVNALRPGVVSTPLTSRPSGIEDPQSGKELTVAETYALMAEGGSQAVPRIGKPDEIAYAAYAFTHIPYMTGQLVAVDGGFTLVNGFPNRELFLREGFRRRSGSAD